MSELDDEVDLLKRRLSANPDVEWIDVQPCFGSPNCCQLAVHFATGDVVLVRVVQRVVPVGFQITMSRQIGEVPARV